MTTRQAASTTRYAVYGPGAVHEPLIIDAENWVFALGIALELLEREDWISRLSCEMHPDGTVLAEDRVTRARYLVHKIPYTPVVRPEPQVSAETTAAMPQNDQALAPLY